MLSPKRFPQLILAAIALFTIVMGVLVFIHPPALYPDPSWGFQVMRGMHMGGGFNMLQRPDYDDISRNSPVFLSWWSPGQYLVPYFFINTLKLNIGQAAALSITICSLIGLAGFYTFFKKIGFTPIIAALSIAFIAGQEAYLIPFVFYNGGEVILFAFAGWFLYGCANFTKVSWQMIVFMLASGLIGFFCKSSFLWIYFAGALYLWLQLLKGKTLKGRIISALSIGIPAALSLAIIYFGYISKGDNPTATTGGAKLTWETFGFPLASPLLAAFSIDDLTGGIITRPIIVILLLAICSVALVVYIYKKVPNTNYTSLLCIFYLVAVLFYGINFLRQANISYEARHMRLLGLIITPGIIYLISRAKKPFWFALALCWLYIGSQTCKFIHAEYKRNMNKAGHGTTGFAQIFIDQSTLNYINQIDQQKRNAIFVFISPDLGLEINHNRVITCPALDDNLQPENDLYAYNGHAGPIYLIIPKSYLGPKANVYFKNFPEYSNFSVVKPGNDYVVYYAQ